MREKVKEWFKNVLYADDLLNLSQTEYDMKAAQFRAVQNRLLAEMSEEEFTELMELHKNCPAQGKRSLEQRRKKKKEMS